MPLLEDMECHHTRSASSQASPKHTEVLSSWPGAGTDPTLSLPIDVLPLEAGFDFIVITLVYVLPQRVAGKCISTMLTSVRGGRLSAPESRGYFPNIEGDSHVQYSHKAVSPVLTTSCLSLESLGKPKVPAHEEKNFTSSLR